MGYGSLFGLIPGWLWIALGVVIALGILGLLGSIWWFKQQATNFQVETQRSRSERWASTSQVRELVGQLGQDSRRLPVGQLPPPRQLFRRRLAEWALCPVGSSKLICAPTTAGKTSRVLVRDVITHRGPAAVFSIKPDLFYLTLMARSKRGPIYVFDPANSLGVGSVAWSPLLGIQTFDDATRTGWILTEAAGSGGHEPAGDKSFWRGLAEHMLAPLLFYAAQTGHTMTDVVSWVENLEDNERPIASGLGQLGNQRAIDAWTAFRSTERRPRGSIQVTARDILQGWSTELIAPSLDTANADQVLDLDEFLDQRKASLYVIAPQSDQRLYAPVFTALAAAIVRTVQDRSHRQGRAISPRLLLCLDEAANIAPLRNLDEVASSGSGQGIILETAWQDFSQIRKVYGPERADEIRSNHPVKLFMPGISDEATLTYLKTVLGPVPMTVLNTSGERFGTLAEQRVSTHTTESDLLPTSDMRQLDSDLVLAVVSRRPPMRLRVPGWFEDDTLRSLIDPDVTAIYDRQYADTEHPDQHDEPDPVEAALV
jgi:type IV secretory pathway TraG/TraD family ATPase VirD4